MAKATTQEPKAAKPSIKFCPKLKQYEAGIDFVQADGMKIKITLDGYVPPTMEDERKLLRAMEVDKNCGITTWENREMPPEQKASETELRKEQAKNAAMAEEMESLRAELARLQGSQSK